MTDQVFESDGLRPRIFEVLSQAKLLAREYYALTKKPLGITGELSEYEAARHLGLVLSQARTAGYDAIDPLSGRKLQIKGRVVFPHSKPGQRLGSIDIRKEFDAVLLVILNQNFDATSIYLAERSCVIEALTKPGSKSRNERGALGISTFKSITQKVWELTPTPQIVTPTDVGARTMG